VRSAVNLIRGIGNGETGSSKRLTKFKHAQSKNYEETRALHPNICAGSGTLQTFVRLRSSASCASSPHHGSRHYFLGALIRSSYLPRFLSNTKKFTGNTTGNRYVNGSSIVASIVSPPLHSASCAVYVSDGTLRTFRL
jgi:hypothetical protein